MQVTITIKKNSSKGQYSGFPDFILAFQYLREAYKKNGDKLLGRAYYDRRKGRGFKLKEGGFRWVVKKKFLKCF